MSAIVELSGVSKSFPTGKSISSTVLSDINFTVDRGEFVTIVGGSGCGKSTILRMLSGLIPPSSGKIVCNSDRVEYIFQEASLLPWRTLAKNVELFLELAKVPRQKRKIAVDKALHIVRLKEYQKLRPHELSGGMKMRASIARSLTLQPEIFLFDEPFGALDEINRQHLIDELSQLFYEQKFSAVFVTHSIPEAVFLAHKLIVISGKPGTKVYEKIIPFDFPRKHDIRFSSEFNSLVAEISTKLKESHE